MPPKPRGRSGYCSICLSTIDFLLVGKLNVCLTSDSSSSVQSQSEPTSDSNSPERDPGSTSQPCTPSPSPSSATAVSLAPIPSKLKSPPGHDKLEPLDALTARSKTCKLCGLLLRTLHRNGIFRAFRRGVPVPAVQHHGQGVDDFGVVTYDENGMSDHDGRNAGDQVFVGIRVTLGRKWEGRVGELSVRFEVVSRNRYGRKKAGVGIGEVVGVGVLGETPSSVPIRPYRRLADEDRLEKLRSLLDLAPGPASQPSVDHLPGRILEISGLVDMKVRLVNVSSWFQQHSPDSTLEYVSLSHRWRTLEQCITTTHNVAQRMSWFPASELPQTFHDACFCTIRLGYRFLWIDALCILQDSQADWAVESLKMGDVFQAAQVVLAAHGAHDAAEGFLAKALRAPDGDEITLPTEPVVVLRLRQNFETDVVRSHLSKRGWVMQERLLATRSLHFTDGHIYLESPRRIWVEGVSEILYDHAENDVDGKVVGALTKLLHPAEFPDEPALSTSNNIQDHWTYVSPFEQDLDQPELSAQWGGLVQLYSSCDLTREEDKLIAISGITNLIHRSIGGVCHAGLLSHCFFRGLLWMRQGDQLTFPARKRAPSWSWASVDGPVQYPEEVHSAALQQECDIWVDGLAPTEIQKRSIVLIASIVNLGTYLRTTSNPCHKTPVWLWPRSESGAANQPSMYGWSIPMPNLRYPVPVFAVLSGRAIYNTREELVLGWFSLDNHSNRGEGEAEVEETLRRWDKDVLFARLAHDSKSRMDLGILLAPCGGQYVRIGAGQLRFERVEWDVEQVEIV